MIYKKKKLVYIDVTGGKRDEKEKWFESNHGNHNEVDKLIEQFRYDTGCEIVRIEYDESDTYNEWRDE